MPVCGFPSKVAANPANSSCSWVLVSDGGIMGWCELQWEGEQAVAELRYGGIQQMKNLM